MTDYSQKISKLEKENIRLKAKVKDLELHSLWYKSVWNKAYRISMTYVMFLAVFYVLDTNEFYLDALFTTGVYTLFLFLKGFVKMFWIRRTNQ